MFSRVLRNRLPKTVQIRRFCQPEKPKIEQLYKKFQNDPELKDLLKDVFKNESVVVGNKTTDMSRLFDMLENKAIVIEESGCPDLGENKIKTIKLEEKNIKKPEIKKGPIEEVILNCFGFYVIGFGIMFVLVSIGYMFIFAKELLKDFTKSRTVVPSATSRTAPSFNVIFAILLTCETDNVCS